MARTHLYGLATSPLHFGQLMGITYPKPIRILCVDDDASYIRLLCAILAAEIDMDAVGTLADLSRLDETVASLCPDVILLDMRMDGHRPIDVIRRASEHCQPSRVIAMSSDTNRSVITEAIEAGAWAFVNKSEPPSVVLDAVRRVMRDEVVVRA